MRHIVNLAQTCQIRLLCSSFNYSGLGGGLYGGEVGRNECGKAQVTL